MTRIVSALLVCALLVGCGGSSSPRAQEPAPSPDDGGWAGIDLTPEPGFDPDDPALQTLPEDEAHAKLLIKRAGSRQDFKIPRDMAEELDPGPLVLAVVIRPFWDGDASAMRHMNAGQRAVHAMYVADAEILNGGFAQLWDNPSGAVAADLAGAAKRVGSPEFEGIFRDAAALWPGAAIPRDDGARQAAVAALDGARVSELDERYAATQYRRRTALATLLGGYIRAHLDEFVVG
jgi:hypothetical protein